MALLPGRAPMMWCALVLPLLASPARATVYEDGGGGGQWRVADGTPAGARVASVPDGILDGDVVETLGDGRSNAYLLGGTSSSTGWNNTTESHLSFRLRTTESFTVYARVATRDGGRWLVYNQSDRDNRGSATARYIHHGLGGRARDGRWRVFGRDLAADLADVQPDNELLAVNGFLVRGNVRIDEVTLGTEPVAERVLPALRPDVDLDAEDGDSSMWSVFDDRPAGATVTVAPGETRDGKVYVLTGSGRGNGFRVGGTDATDGWNNTRQTVMSWALRSPRLYRVSVRIDTARGPRFLNYDSTDSDSLAHPNGRDIGFGVGGATTDDTWRDYARDLAADLARVEPDNTLLAVQGLYVRGSLRIDDIALVDDVPDATDATPPSVALTATPASGEAPLVVRFDPSASSATRDIATAVWDFGDGGDDFVTDTLAGVEYTYGAGRWTATLTLTDTAGNVGRRSVDIVATAATVDDDEPPVAAFTATPGDADDPLLVTFDASASNDDEGVVAWTWDFGDGTEGGSGEIVRHAYATPGTRTVTLTVADAAGLEAGVSRDVTTGENTGTDAGTGTGTGTEPPGPVTDADRDAARLLAQATFGATESSIARVKSLGTAGWIDDQLRRQGPAHLDYVRVKSNGSSRQARHDIWWGDAITGDDQLRQRVAFALSQIFVISDTGYTLANAQYGVTDYYDILRAGAFGSYRELLEKITLHPVMGIYLSMLQNDKGDALGNTRPDENFAREVLQLFSIGPHALAVDGTIRTRDGVPIPSYTQAQVEDYARVFTGWNFASATRWDFPILRSDADKVRPMLPDEAHHDTDPKTLLGGVTTPAGATARVDLEIALDSIANHPGVGPFITKQLIQRLVTSNPTPAYVRRTTAVFDDDGTGARGNLGAVVRAILLDREARVGHRSVADFGKLREPVLRVSHLWRAFDAQPGTASTGGIFNTKSPHVKDLDSLIGQAVLKSPSVFNFYRPDHAPLGEIRGAGHVAPEAEIYTDGNILATTTRINSHVQLHHDRSDANSLKSTFIDLSTERALLASGGPDALLDRLDLLLLAGGMSDGLRQVVREHVETFADTPDGRSGAVRDAITLIMASPAYLVQL